MWNEVWVFKNLVEKSYIAEPSLASRPFPFMGYVPLSLQINNGALNKIV